MLVLAYTKTVPIVQFHGYGAVCDNPFSEYLGKKLQTYSICVEPKPDDPRNYSVNTPLMTQGAVAWDMTNNDPNLQGEFDLVGWSQGTLMSRYIIEFCQLNGKVRKFVAFGGPINGESNPQCSWYDISCFINRYYTSSRVYTDGYQESWAPAGYWREPGKYKKYLEKSSFIAYANNEVDFSQERKDKFLGVENHLYILWDNDGTIIPTESSHWGQWAEDSYTLLHRNQTRVYKDDLIGIRQLEEEGRAEFVTIPGVHMEYTFDQVDSIVIPFLTK